MSGTSNENRADKKASLAYFLIRFVMSGWGTFLLFCGIVVLAHHLLFSPSDIRGRKDFLKFQIVAQEKSNLSRIAFCTFEPGPAREIVLEKLQQGCFYDGGKPFSLGSLVMAKPSGQVPLIKEDPDYGWTRYAVLSEKNNSQLIETETYYNSDGLVTRYRVTGNIVEPIGQINVTRGLNQMFVLFYMPIALLMAKLAASLLRKLIRRCFPFSESQSNASLTGARSLTRTTNR
jgi:hypothetical protein